MSSYPAPGQSWPPQGDQGHDPIVTPEDRNWVVAAHLGSFLTAWFTLGLVAPLVVLLLKGGSSPFVRRHAVESLNFQINAFVWSIVFVILAVALIGIPLLLGYGAFYVICVVVATARASAGREYRYPLTFRIVS